MDVTAGKYLGKLCKHGHDWDGTGMSVRYAAGDGCCECIRKYNSKPEVQQRALKWGASYRAENRDKVREQAREYQRNNKDKAKLYSQLPRVRERRNATSRERSKRPDVREKRRIYYQKPEVKERQKEYRQLPEVVEKRRIYNERPEVKACRNANRKKPERKAARRTYVREYLRKRGQTVEGTYLGKLCPKGHDCNGTGMSMRYKKNWMCVECVRASKKTEKAKETKRKYYQLPEVKARRSAYAKEQRNDPVVREKQRKRSEEYSRANRDEVRRKGRERGRTPEGKKKAREYYKENREKALAYAAEYHKANKEKISKYGKKHYLKNKERLDQYGREWLAKHPNSAKEYFQKNKERIIEKRRSDPKYVLNRRMSSHMRLSLRGSKGGRSWESLVGYTVEELRAHLESQFVDGMSWENMGEWHIDHILPIFAFDFTKPEDDEFKQCWALDNLQPLWAVDNLKKGARWIDG